MEHVSIYEVGPRDGLQNEKNILSPDTKIQLVNMLSEAGFEKIEVTSFVSPKWVPQLADASQVMAGITKHPKTTYTALTPNLEGFERALKAGVNEVAIFAAASETFSQKNINCSIDESIKRFEPVVDDARQNNIKVRGYVSCIAGCPYEGDIEPSAVLNVSDKLMELGCYEISLGDTIGIGTPDIISTVISLLLKTLPASALAGHYHDTHGRALENVKVSLDLGLRTFDSAIGGLGGCPYAPGAKGNLSTILLEEFLEKEGYVTGLVRDKLFQAENFINDKIRNTHS